MGRLLGRGPGCLSGCAADSIEGSDGVSPGLEVGWQLVGRRGCSLIGYRLESSSVQRLELTQSFDRELEPANGSVSSSQYGAAVGARPMATARAALWSQGPFSGRTRRTTEHAGQDTQLAAARCVQAPPAALSLPPP